MIRPSLQMTDRGRKGRPHIVVRIGLRSELVLTSRSDEVDGCEQLMGEHAAKIVDLVPDRVVRGDILDHLKEHVPTFAHGIRPRLIRPRLVQKLLEVREYGNVVSDMKSGIRDGVEELSGGTTWSSSPGLRQAWIGSG